MPGRSRGRHCALVREALSARADDEVPPLTDDAVRRHRAACAACDAFAADLEGLARRVRAGTGPAVPDGGPAVVAALAAASADARARRRRELRLVVAVAGLAQLLWALALLLGLLGSGGHLGRDLGALQLALATGFLLAAAQPHRVAGVLPVGVAVVAAVLATALVDVVGGRADLLAELTHGSELVGVLALWALGRGRDPGSGAVTAVTA